MVRRDKMRKTVSIIFFLLLAVLLSACNSKTSTFFGENENWIVKLNINKNSDFAEGNYVAEYKGKNLEELLKKEVHYQVDYKTASSGGSVYLNDVGVLEGTAFKQSCGLGCSYTKIDSSELIFTVIIDGESEILTLNTTRKE